MTRFSRKQLVRTSTLALLAVCLFASPRSSFAQTPEGATTDRDGWMLGIGLGIGEMSAECNDGCDGALAAVSVDAHVGYMINPRLGVVLDVWALGHPAEDATLFHTITTLGAQYWVANKFWLFGGLGGGYISIEYDDESAAESETAPALTLAGGYQILQRNGFSLDVQLRAGATLFDDASETTVYNSSLSLGVGWY